jgi:hypothetical protein
MSVCDEEKIHWWANISISEESRAIKFEAKNDKNIKYVQLSSKKYLSNESSFLKKSPLLSRLILRS